MKIKNIDTLENIFSFMYGLECCQIVADCFQNIDGIENGSVLPGAEDSGWANPFSKSMRTLNSSR